MYDVTEGLNESQMKAVMTTEGFVRVIAGAGSGKTGALTRRFAFLVNEVGILPGNILCVTFTNKAANEMRQRIHRMTGDNDTGMISTFHGFCVSVLMEDSHAVSYPKNFLVLDNSDINQMLGIIYEERGLSLRDMTFGQARDMIEMIKCVERPDYYRDMIRMSVEALRKKYEEADNPKDIIFYGYLYQEKKCFGLDYNDLIKFTLYIYETDEEIRLKWQTRLEYIMIDEFQDIDPLQYRLMEVLCAYHKNLFIVGDPDQTIYTWRGADVRYLLDFDSHFPGTETIMLMQNYRSTPEIIRAVNSLIAVNRLRVRKDLIATEPSGPKVLCHHAKTADKEADFIAERIEELARNGIPFGDITILYRAHYVTRAIEAGLGRKEIPYRIISGVQFYERAEIKDALAYLRMIAFQDDLSFRRIVNVPKRNIGDRRIRFLEEAAEKAGTGLYESLVRNLDDELFKGTGARTFVRLIEQFSKSWEGRPVSEVMTSLMDESGYERMLRTEGSQERLDNLAELKQSIYTYEISCGEETTLTDYLRHAALFTNSDTEDNGGKVRLMTVHTAKGLEFPYVFLCGMNEGVFPSRKINTEAGMEEERRLAFVAMTRAEKALVLTEAEGRNFDGSPRYPSRFILDIDPDAIEFTSPPDEKLIREARAYASTQRRYYKDNPDRLIAGQRIRHSVFGDGSIQEIDAAKGAYVVKFDSMATNRTISFRAKLEKIEDDRNIGDDKKSE